MHNNDYNIALFIFFIPYILFEVPSNLVGPQKFWLVVSLTHSYRFSRS